MEFEVFIDKWEGNIDKGISCPLSENEIEKNLRMLDGRISTQLLVLPANKKSSLLIGGGNNGLYVVTYTIGNDEEFFNLTNPKMEGSGEVELVTGGQAGIFSAKHCVVFDDVLKALAYYAKTGERNPSLTWEQS